MSLFAPENIVPTPEPEATEPTVPAAKLTFKNANLNHVVVCVTKVRGGFIGYLRELPPEVDEDGEPRYVYTTDNRIQHALILRGMPSEADQERIRIVCDQFPHDVFVRYRTLGELVAARTPKPKFKR